MKVAIVRYPGSNCDFDAKRYFGGEFVWHTDNPFTKCYDLIVIPGGFAFGDRTYNKATETYEISPGQKALESEVSDFIKEAAYYNIPILGICNGFQILVKLGLLPGKLERNSDGRFHSKYVDCIFEDDSVFKIPIANQYGRYVGDENDAFLLYKDYGNGIAGVRKGNVFGMMPHPERLPNNHDLKHKLLKLIFNYTVSDLDIKRIMESEHVSYKSTKKYLKSLPCSSPHVIQGPGENAGIIDIGGGYALCLRIESHNHPIFINPFQGAATGVGGILRDIFTMGARPIALLDFLRFGTDERAKEIEEGAISGISYYGNCVGVPVVGGEIYRDEVYNKNPLLNVACIGIIKKENIIYGNVKENNSVLVYIGAKTGAEGIGGADMASKQFSGDVSKLEDNVQTGDPFLEKLLLEVCCELSETDYVDGMQDMGAGGLLCSSLELVQRGREKFKQNFGCEIYLDEVPCKEGLSHSDILISESQERMLLVCNENNYDDIVKICNKWDLEVVEVGRVTNDGNYSVYNDNILVYNTEIDNFTSIEQDWKLKPYTERRVKKLRTSTQLWEQYDNTLNGRTIKGPLEPGSYAIIDIHEIGKKLYITWGGSVDECNDKMSNFQVKRKALVNCLNFGHPKDCMKEFSDAVTKLKQASLRYCAPVVGGNVSLYNCTDGVSIPPSPMFMMVAIEH